MGGLIQTAGTKRLAAHYNEEFDQFIEFYRGPNVIGFFDRGAPPKNLNVWDDVVQAIQHNATTDPLGDFPDHTNRSDGLCLVPNDKKTHKNLINRWRLYLRKFLPAMQHGQLIDAINNVLKDHTISYIVFDVVASGGGYGIASVRHTDSDGNDFQQITLQTTELPIDPGFGSNYIRDHRPV